MSDSIRNKRVRIKSEFPVPTALWGKEGVVISAVEGLTEDNPWVVVTIGPLRYQLRVNELEVLDDCA